MSVYVKGMGMPTSCNKCRFFVDAWCYALEFDDWRNAYNKPPEGERLSGCPLIPVPDHGRLGDLDAAVEKLKRLREYHSDDSQSGVFIAHGISQCIEVLTGKEAPAIIPADQADEEGEG